MLLKEETGEQKQADQDDNNRGKLSNQAVPDAFHKQGSLWRTNATQEIEYKQNFHYLQVLCKPY